MTRPRTLNPRFHVWPLALLALCMVAIWPLLRTASPCSHDGALHYFRVVALRHNLQNGTFFTRYLPDLAFGYGYPFFNYRAPLPYYLALGLYSTGLPLPLALNLVYVLSILGCALGAYLLARDLFGPGAGVVAAVSYAYASYLFLDALLRANMPEPVALALLPFLLWAFRRLALEGSRRWFLTSVGLLAALLLTHNISSLLFLPYLLVYLGVLAWVYRRRGHWGWVVLALVVALGMTAFFWLPALAEKEYVQLHMSRVTRNNDFHYNFASLAEVLAPPAPVDVSLMNPPMEIRLGLAAALLALAGSALGLARLRGRERRASLLFFAASAACFLFMSTRASLWLWENLPLLPFVQFPWRLVGRAALPVALLAGALVPAISTLAQRASRAMPPILVGILILAAFPSTYPPLGYCPAAPYATVEDIHRYEHQSKLVGVDPEGSYFPIWVAQRPEGSPLEEQYAAGTTVARFDERALPEGAAVLAADYGVNRARLVVDSPLPFRARYLAFAFPGWQVRVDGEPVETAPTDPEGLIGFDVPAGRHVLSIRFGETPLRLATDVLSAAALLMLVGFAIRGPKADAKSSSPPATSPARTWPLLLVAFLILTLKLAVVDRIGTPFRRPSLQADGTLPDVTHALDQPYADGMTLIGFDQSTAATPADGTLRLDLYWTVRQRPSRPYRAVVYLVGPDGFLWSPPGIIRPRGYHDPPPTNAWEPGHYALDSHEAEPLPGTPPGTYRVVVTLFDRETLAPLSVLNEAGQPVAPDLTLGDVTLTRPSCPATVPSRDRLDLRLAGFTLLTADLDREQATPGDSVHVTLLWRAECDGNTAPASSIATLSLFTEEEAVAEYELAYPVSSWQAGDVWRSQQRLTLPATLETGAYTWAVGATLSSGDLVARISVVALPHAYTAPQVDLEIGARLGDVATLVGATVEPEGLSLQPGAPLTATLAWRAEGTATESYHVLLHLLDPEGRLVAQSDGVPAAWTRPTTGWLAGEYITDVRRLTTPPDAPAGEYTLQAGLYVPGGERLTDPDGANAVPLVTITVESR